MQAVNRFDGSGAAPNGGGNGASSSRLAALAAKKKQQPASPQQQSQPTPPSAAPRPATSTAPSRMPQIHPSRLASAPLLAQSMKRAGVKKEKTKAKQRYLNKKKNKRKAKLKSGKTKSSIASDVRKHSTTKGASVPESQQIVPQPQIQKSASSSSSDSGSSSSSSSSESDSDSDSDSDSESSDDDVDVDETMQEDTPGATVQKEEEEATTANTLVPLPRNRPLHRTTAEALQSLAAQGLPRGMVQPQIIDASLKADVNQPSNTTTATGDVPGIAGVTLDSTMTKRLAEMGITEWFAVQTAVIPHLLSIPSRPSPFNPPRDLCVSAPTGSGKTLAYAIPMITHLRSRIVPRLRGLIILPTRDLIVQVRETFELLSKGTNLRIGSTAGTHSFAQEQAMLVDDGGDSAQVVDIVVTTPGRLVDHLDETRGFTLEHLRFLVIDEADRLLGQSFHDWAKRIRTALKGENVVSTSANESNSSFATHRLHALRPATYDAAGCEPSQPEPVVQKLLFSATLTRDVGKLSELGLRDPVFIDVRGQDNASSASAAEGGNAALSTYTLPASLHEHMMVVPGAMKPLYLIWLLLMNPVKRTIPRGETKTKTEWVPMNDGPMERVLIFTKSVDSAQRLVKVLQGFFGSLDNKTQQRTIGSSQIAAYTSDLTMSQRRKILSDFKTDSVTSPTILIASDLISRGIDLPSVEHVISYDIPSDVSKYIHRSGRTSRGISATQGKVWNLIQENEAKWFKSNLATGHLIRRSNEMIKIKMEEKKVVQDIGGEDILDIYKKNLKKVVKEFSKSASTSL
ncbi:unnamed protein product [Sympodiomycopsis kandeliae]